MSSREFLDALAERLWQRLGPGAERPEPDYDRSSALGEARLIVQKCTGASAAAVLSGDAPGDPAAMACIERLARARQDGWPMAYLLGEQAFYSHSFAVNPYVLIPRPETELLVETALRLLPASSPARIFEAGAGSGCVAISLALERPHWRIEASERWRAVLEVARRNGERHRASNIHWRLASWLDDLDDDYDAIISNPPYISTDIDTLNALRHEPLYALYGGPDGLDDIHQLIDQAHQRLRRGGWLLLEIGSGQAAAATARAAAKGYADISIHPDLAGHPRVLQARRG